MTITNDTQTGPVEKKHGYAPVNGLDMYYEIQGTGDPLVYIPMGFGCAGVTEFPALTRNRALITMDLQGVGRTVDINRPRSFEQDADDVIALLKHLGITQADLLGECAGGVVAMLIALRRPEIVRRVATYGTVFGPAQDAYKPELLAPLMDLTPDSPSVQWQRENYRKVAPDPSCWPAIWSKVFSIRWSGFGREELMSLQMPVLIAVGDHDWVRLDHVLETFSLIPDAELAVIPDAGHFALHTDQTKLLPAVEAFLDAPRPKVPFATTETGYHPGATR